MNKNMTLDELKEEFKGRGGDIEAESIVVDSNFDKKDGYVTVWTNKVDASKIIQRCKKDILKYEIQGDGILFYIDRRAFRGVVYAFRSTKD